METNPYEYDRTVSWMPQQNQVYAGSGTKQYGQQRQSLRQASASQTVGAAQKLKPPKPMPKVRALALAHTLKQWLVVASFVGFGTLSGLVALHQVGTTSASSQSSQTKQTSTTSSQKTSTSSSNGFLKQQGKSNAGSSNSSQGSSSTGSSSSSSSTSSTNNSGSSSSSSSSSSQPVTGTRTS